MRRPYYNLMRDLKDYPTETDFVQYLIILWPISVVGLLVVDLAIKAGRLFYLLNIVVHSITFVFAFVDRT